MWNRQKLFKVECVSERIRTENSKYSKTCLSWPPTVPEKVVNIRKWSTYTDVSQNNFRAYSYFISYLIYSQAAIYFSGSQLLHYLKIWRHTWIEENKLKIHTNKFRFYLLMHVEIAQHINGDGYGQKSILI
jgi:hypothetical protein